MTRLGTASLTKDDVNGVGGAVFGTEQEYPSLWYLIRTYVFVDFDCCTLKLIYHFSFVDCASCIFSTKALCRKADAGPP